MKGVDVDSVCCGRQKSHKTGSSLFKKKKQKTLFTYLFLAALGLPCCTGFFLVVARGGYSLGAEHGFLVEVTSSVMEHGLWALRLQKLW